MNVLFWERCDFNVSFVSRGMSGKVWNRPLGSSLIISESKGPLTITSVISQIVGIKFRIIPFAFHFAFKMHTGIKEKSFQHSIHQVNYMLAYQPVFYNGVKRTGVRDLEEYYNGLSKNISNQVVLYYDKSMLLRYNTWKSSDNTRQSDKWIKLTHV